MAGEHVAEDTDRHVAEDKEVGDAGTEHAAEDTEHVAEDM